MLLIGEDPKKHIESYSKEFINNFLDLLRTTHGEKKVHINHFYQQVIADKTVRPFLPSPSLQEPRR
jgi:DNA/RNA-binding protein KIN17